MNISNNKKLFLDFSSILLIFFPVALILGPFLSELFMNIISLIFLLFFLKNHKFYYLRFIFLFFIFYIYILFNSYFSIYSEKIFLKNIFYFRYAIFVFAIINLLDLNKNLLILFYKSLAIILFVVIIDGYFQYIFEYNLIGYPKYRPDRISGFFDDKLILGSYLARISPLFLGLFLINKKKLNLYEYLFSLILILNIFILILLTGERTALVFSILVLFTFIIFIEIKLKFYFVALLLILFTHIIILNPQVRDRLFHQTISQVQIDKIFSNFFGTFKYYNLTYRTAVNGFLEKKLFGQGAGTFRFFCNKPSIEVYEIHKIDKKDLEILKFNVSWKQLNNRVVQLFKKNGDNIKKGDLFFTYLYNNKLNKFYYNSYSGKIKSLDFSENTIINPGQYLAEINFDDTRKEFYEKNNGCTTHPHNFYLQLLSETGLFGFFYILSFFIYFFLKLMVCIYKKIILRKSDFDYLEILIISGFVMSLFPLMPNGNFFNNWMNMIMFLPIPFYLNSLKNREI